MRIRPDDSEWREPASAGAREVSYSRSVRGAGRLGTEVRGVRPREQQVLTRELWRVHLPRCVRRPVSQLSKLTPAEMSVVTSPRQDCQRDREPPVPWARTLPPSLLSARGTVRKEGAGTGHQPAPGPLHVQPWAPTWTRTNSPVCTCQLRVATAPPASDAGSHQKALCAAQRRLRRVRLLLSTRVFPN